MKKYFLKNNVQIFCFAALAVMLAWSVEAVALPPQYSIEDLGTVSGGYVSWAYGINSSGQVVGASCTESQKQAFLWENGSVIDIGALAGGNTQANGINDSGQIVGASSTGASTHAFISNNGTMTDLGTLGGIYSNACGINSSGQVVGYSNIALSSTHAFLWQNGVMTDLGAGAGGYSYAQAINDLGRIAGHIYAGGVSGPVFERGTSTDRRDARLRHAAERYCKARNSVSSMLFTVFSKNTAEKRTRTDQNHTTMVTLQAFEVFYPTICFLIFSHIFTISPKINHFHPKHPPWFCSNYPMAS
ncbi:MAG: hypothetical protein GY850_43725 [bacterium]|nr:hypothetical protein [bacterium]